MVYIYNSTFGVFCIDYSTPCIAVFTPRAEHETSLVIDDL